MTKERIKSMYGKRVRYADPKTGVDCFGVVVGYDQQPTYKHQPGDWIVISPDKDKIGPWIHVLDAELVV